MKYLFTTQISNDLGLLVRSLPVARELAKRGHELAFCNPAPAPSKLIAEAGLDNLVPRHPLYYFTHLQSSGELNVRGLYRVLRSGRLRRHFGGLGRPLRQTLRAMPTKFTRPTGEVWSIDHLAAMLFMMNERYVRAEVDALAELITDFGADVVVDSWHPPACLAARVLRKPLVTIIQADMHPDSGGFIWWKEHPPDLPTPVPALNRIRASHGLDPLNKTEELFRGDLTLVLGTPETDPLPATAQVTYIGPVLWQKEGVEPPEFLKYMDTDEPLVWAYSGNPRYFRISNPMDSKVVLQACITALAGEKVQVILSTGHHKLPKEFLPLPANFHYEPFVPGLLVAERSDLLIHHGGYGSCQTGLYTGTPAVIIPTYSERESNARRVAAVGAGEFIVPGKKRRVPADELRAKIIRVLSDPQYVANARRISEKLRAYGGPPEVARLIEEFGAGDPRIFDGGSRGTPDKEQVVWVPNQEHSRMLNSNCSTKSPSGWRPAMPTPVPAVDDRK